jgi:hypothetical protein
MVCLRIESEQAAERGIALQLQRFGCRILEQAPGELRVEFPDAETEHEALVETRLYLGARIRAVLSARPA